MSNTDTLPPKQRSSAIDAVRVLGIIAVVAGHVWEAQLTPFVYTWHVPLFFFLTGYFWSAKRSIANEAKRRGRVLGLPYVTWLVIIGIPYALSQLSGGLSLSTFAGPLYGGGAAVRPFTTFWFVSVLFFTALLYRAISSFPLWAKATVAALGLAAGYVFGEGLAVSPLAAGSALGCLVWVFLGDVTARYIEPKISRPVVVGLALLAVSVALIAIGWSAPVNIKLGHYGTPVLSIVVAAMLSFGLVLLAKVCFRRIGGSPSAWVIALAQSGFATVLAHPAVLWLLMWVPGEPDWIGFTLALVLPWALGLIALRTPLSIYVTGSERTTTRTLPVHATIG